MKNFLDVLFDVGSYFFHWQIVGINSKWIFNFFRYQFQTCQYIEHKRNYGNHIISHTEHIAKRQGHYINEDEFLDKYTVRKGNGRVLDPLTGTAYIRERFQFFIQDDEFVAGNFSLLVQMMCPFKQLGCHLIRDVFALIDLWQNMSMIIFIKQSSFG